LTYSEVGGCFSGQQQRVAGRGEQTESFVFLGKKKKKKEKKKKKA